MKPSPPQTVAQLIAAFRTGNASAGDALFRQFEPWLQLLARGQIESRFGAKFDAADLVQQTLLEATRAFAQFRGQSEPELLAWLRQIFTHVLAHEIRRYGGTQKRDLDLEVSLDQEVSRTSLRLADWIAASATSVGGLMERREREALLARVLDRLPEAYRTVLVLRHLEGLTHEQIARRLGRNPGAVRMLWVRALARLRAELPAEPTPSRLPPHRPPLADSAPDKPPARPG